MSDPRKFAHGFFDSLTLRFSRFWASCGSVWFIRQQVSAAPVSQPSTTVEELPSFSERSSDVTSSAQNEESISSPDWHLVLFVWRFVSAFGARFIWGSRRGLQDRDSQHGDSLTDTRTEKASATELSALELGSRVVEMTAGRDVYEERVCV